MGTFLNFHTNMVLSIESKMDWTPYRTYHSYKTGTRLVLPQVPTTQLYFKAVSGPILKPVLIHSNPEFKLDPDLEEASGIHLLLKQLTKQNMAIWA